MTEEGLKSYITGFLDSANGQRWLIEKVSARQTEKGAEIVIKLEWLKNPPEISAEALQLPFTNCEIKI